MYWNKTVECADREYLEDLQLSGLKKTVLSVYRNVETYRFRMQAAGIRPEDIQSLDDCAVSAFQQEDRLKR